MPRPPKPPLPRARLPARRKPLPAAAPPRDLIDRLLARHQGAPTRFALLIDRRRPPLVPVSAVATGTAAAGAVLASIGALEGAALPVMAGLALVVLGIALARRKLPSPPIDTGPRWNPKALLDLDRALAEAEPSLDAGAHTALDRIHDALVRLSHQPRPRWRLEDAVAVERLIERHLPEALAAAAAQGPAPLEPVLARLAAIEARLALPPTGSSVAH